jgi:hypothetical protein
MAKLNDVIFVDPTGIPAELRDRAQWVTRKTEAPSGRKPTKIPYDPKTQRRAKTNDPTTWGTFADAFCIYQKGFDGVGYVFAADDEYFGIDLDACRNPNTCELTSWARTIVTRFDTYTEVSPSGFGVKLTAKGRLPLNGGSLGNPMFNPKHPTVLALRRMGFKLAVHGYFADDAVSLCATAHDPEEKLTFHGRSKCGDFEEAIKQLGRAAGVLDRGDPQ